MNAGHGDILQMLLHLNKIDVTELSKRADIPRTTLYSILKRNGTNTRTEVLQKICKALNVEKSVWELSEEELSSKDVPSVLQQEKLCISKEYVKMAMELRHMNYHDLALLLKYVGILYDQRELERIIEGQIPILKEENEIIKYILENEQIFTAAEMRRLIQYRSLQPKDQDVIGSVIDRFVVVDSAEKNI